jgi:hypothetical protein
LFKELLLRLLGFLEFVKIDSEHCRERLSMKCLVNDGHGTGEGKGSGALQLGEAEI